MSGLEEAKRYLGDDMVRYREALSAEVHSGDSFVNSISNYILAHKGKEFRPVLSLFTGRACGGLTDSSYFVAVVAEMLHSATLMHDDVADEATLRRNHPTVGALFSSTAAVLVGDFWLSRALHILTTKCAPKIISVFTEAVQKMAEGELIQMGKAKSLDMNESDYFAVIERKTSALFVACAKSAAYAANASNMMVDAFEKYALHLGNAFQIRDDIFDYSEDLDTGKMAGADLKERKITIPLLCAMEQNPLREKYIRERIALIDEKKKNPEDYSAQELSVIKEAVAFVKENRGIENAQKKLEEQGTLAIKALDFLPDSKEKEFLTGFAEYVGKRVN